SHHPRRRNAADGVMGRAVRFRARCRGIMARNRASEGVPPMLSWAALVLALSLSAATAFAAESKWPNHHEADFVVKDYAFTSGESQPEGHIHYHTLGTPKRNAAGETVNAILLLQGNTGTAANWLRPSLGDELFAVGQPFDAEQNFIIFPDAIGRGGSSKPSD